MFPAVQETLPSRDPQSTQVWLVGSGIASLSAAVHLLNDAKIPGANIHVLDLHTYSGGAMNPYGDPQRGYFLPFECHPHFHGSCMERLLSLVPSETQPGRSLMEAVRNNENFQRPVPKNIVNTRALKLGDLGPVLVYTEGIHIGIKNRIALINLLLTNEDHLASKSIEDVLDKSLFGTTFWMLWATSFQLQPWHSAAEFKRHLRKYLEDIQSLNNLKTANRTEFNLYESLVLPITGYLKNEGVNFHFKTEVTDLRFYPESDPSTVIGIDLVEDGEEKMIEMSPADIVIVTLGSTSGGAVLGTNDCPPPNLSLDCEAQMVRDWKLWQKLARRSPKFGDPSNFLSQGLRPTVETFTTTFDGPEFMRLYEQLTHDRPGTGALVSLSDSNWSISLSIPHQPLFSSQPKNSNIICGYALTPTTQGSYMKKSMYECCGEEILFEVLSYLQFPIEPTLSTSKTVPCGMPLGTSPLLSRPKGSRPRVIPQNTSNIACVGQFAEIPDETTLMMEYSVRGAQIAVAKLMGLREKDHGVRKSLLLETLDLMI